MHFQPSTVKVAACDTVLRTTKNRRNPHRQIFELFFGGKLVLVSLLDGVEMWPVIEVVSGRESPRCYS